MERKRCRCRLFSCFSCFSSKNTTPSAAQPDHSSEIAPVYHSSAVPSTAAPNATDHGPQLIVPPDASSSSTDVLPESNEIAPVDHFSVTSTAAPNATDDALKHPQHGPQPIVPPDASSSSTDVLPDSNEPQPIVHPDLSSSSPLAFPAHDEVYQVSEAASSSNAATDNHKVADDQLQGTPSSSTVSNALHLINSILTAANALDTENVDANVDGLIEYISNLLETIKEKKMTGKKSPKTESGKGYWQIPSDGSIRKIREILSDGINVFKDFFTGEAKTAIQGLFKGMGMAHLACTGLLVAALVLERFDTISSNIEECLCVLDEICKLAHHVNDIKQRPPLRGAMDASIKEAINLIVEASIMCSTQIGSSKGRRFLSASRDNEELVKFQQKLQKMYRHMDSKMGICLYDATQVRPQKPRERTYAVGIKKPVEELKELLEWESEEKAVAVIVYGFGGIGKTTVADAVFAPPHVEGYKYSSVRLFDDVTSKPDIIKLQGYILKDLKMGTPEETTSEEIRTHEDGQCEIGRILEKEKAFIYVDNALERYPFEQLLPKHMGKAKKLRLLITTRDRDVAREFRKLKTKFYPMKVLPHIESKILLETELYGEADNMEKRLSSIQLDHIVEMCGFIPNLLIVVAGFIRRADDPQEAYDRVKEERERNWKGEIGKEIAHYVFAYQYLDEMLKDPFLDICSFFNGWEWSEVADRLGDGDLNNLEKRALVTGKTRGTLRTVWVHDVILAMGLQQVKGTRFSSANKLQEFLDEKEDKEIRKIKGIMLPTKDRSMPFKDPLYISASKLDLMCTSLRLFDLGDSAKVKGKCEKIFEELLYFKGQIFDIPFDVSRSKELKYLDFSYSPDQEFSNYEELLGSISKQLGYLRVLKLSWCKNLRQLTKDFGSLNYLQKLHLDYCQSLEALPSNLGNLSSLKLLDLSGCRRLKDLPCELGKLTSLAQLRLSGCSEVSSIPDSIGQLTSLAQLRLDGCSELSSIPDSIGQLTSLAQLHLSGCSELSSIPDSIGQLTSLVQLHLSGCSEVSSIPDSIGQLKSLDSSMDLSFTGLKELPDGFCSLSFITQLRMVFCKRLKKLPETFGQLKYLELLDLTSCTILEELCRNFNGLSSLQVLSLDSCNMLKKLPEDFRCLASLKVLRLRDCHLLEGKWMESIVEMKTLQVVDITGCPMLKERWEEIEREGDQSWSFVVYTGQGSSNKERIFKQLHSEFDSILINGRVSDLPINTLLLFMLDYGKEFYYGFPLSLIEENIDDIQTNFQMIYVGNHFNELPKIIADRFLGHAPANSNAKALFHKVSATICGYNWFRQLRTAFQMSAKIVSDEKGDKYLSCWELLSEQSVEEFEQSVEEFVIKKCGRYLKLKEVVEKRGGESNIELLRELFATSGEDTFLKNGAAGKVRVEDLEGKTILLDIRHAQRSHDIIPLQPLMEMYLAEKDRLNFEIITIPIMGKSDVFEQRENTKWDVFEQFSRQVPWLLLHNPRQLKTSVNFFLLEGRVEKWPREYSGEKLVAWDRWHPGTMRVIESNGSIAAHNRGVLRMVNTWGAKAYPFTQEKNKELKGEERNQMKAMSNFRFLFKDLESLWDQVKEVKGKMICLYTSKAEAGVAGSIRDVLIELRDNIHIIYIPQYFMSRTWGIMHYTYGIVAEEYVPGEGKRAEIEMMEGMSVLSEEEATRYWARMDSLKECIKEMDDNDKQLDGIKQLLYFIHHGYALYEEGFQDDGYSWMGIIDEDGEVVTTVRKESIENAKELIQRLVKCPKECRKETLVELQAIRETRSDYSDSDWQSEDSDWQSEADLYDSAS